MFHEIKILRIFYLTKAKRVIRKGLGEKGIRTLDIEKTYIPD